MNLLDYFNPISFQIEKQKGFVSNQWTFLDKENAQNIKLNKFPLALITICTEGNGLILDEFRKTFYRLANHTVKPYKAIDLGFLKKGSNFSDTLFATRDVVEHLLNENVCPIILADNYYIPYAIYLAYEVKKKHITISSVEPTVKIRKNNNHYLPQILSRKENTLFNYIILGYQNYFTHQNELNALHTLNFDSMRLGDLQTNISKAEPYLRDSDTFFIHSSSMVNVHLSEYENLSPNGLSVKEVCQLARYAGFNERLTSFAYLFNNIESHQNALALAQIIWHFMDGFYARKYDYPMSSIKKLSKFHVEVSKNNFITFFKSNKSGRWWMEVPLPKTDFKKKWLVACDEDDYLTAVNGIVPDKWYQSFQKVM